MRAFSDADLAQPPNSGTASLASSVSLTLGAGSTEGNAGIAVIGTQVPIIPPDQWQTVVKDPTAALLSIQCRADLPAGESSWQFNAISAASWTWTLAEWANVAFAPVESTAAAAGVGGDAGLSTSSTGSFNTQFVMGIAAFLITSSGGAGWPTVSYDPEWAETDSLQVGDGTVSGDAHLSVVRRYGADGETGPWSCTASFTGSMASKTPFACLAVLRAADESIPWNAGQSVMVG